MPIRTIIAVSVLLAAAALVPAARAEVPGPRQVIGYGEGGVEKTWTLPAGKPYLYVPSMGDDAGDVLTSVTVGAQVGFRVDDIDEAHAAAVAAGAEVLHEPRPEPWGTSARYRDPDGNVIELTQPRH